MVKDKEKEATSEKEEEASVKRAIADLDEQLGQKPREGSPVTFQSIIGGDFLTSRFLRRQAGLVVLVTFFMIIYIWNGYASKKQQIQLSKLKTELDDARYNAITRSSELLEKSRQSRVAAYIQEHEDSSIQMATTPPFRIDLK